MGLLTLLIVLIETLLLVLFILAMYVGIPITRGIIRILKSPTTKIFNKLPLKRLRQHTLKTVIFKHNFLPIQFTWPDLRYKEWVEKREPFLWSSVHSLDFQPLISIVVPVFNTRKDHLLIMVDSVVSQHYNNWELILVDASSNHGISALTKSCEEIDDRIRVIRTATNKGIAGNTNLGLRVAKGEYVGFLDHDDTLAPHALSEVVRLLQVESKLRPELIYSDEDKVVEEGSIRFDPHFKPDWSFHLLKQVNYINHFTVVNTKKLKKAGYIRRGFDGAQDYDLLLRLVDKGVKIAHVPKILYHWRSSKSSTANDISSKSYVLEAGIRALRDHLKRNGQSGSVKAQPNKPGFYEINYRSSKEVIASVILQPSLDLDQYKTLTNRTVSTIKRNTVQTEIFTTNLSIKQLSKNKRISMKSIVTVPDEGFLPKAVSQSTGEVLVFINAGVYPDQKLWLDKLVGLVVQSPEIGAASPLLVNWSNGLITDCGYVIQDNQRIPLFKGYPVGAHTYFGNSDWVRDVSSLSGRVIVIRREVLEKIFSKNEQNMTNTEYNSKLLEGLSNSNMDTIIWPYVTMNFVGDIAITQQQDQTYFNPNLINTGYEFGLQKIINISEDDNA